MKKLTATLLSLLLCSTAYAQEVGGGGGGGGGGGTPGGVTNEAQCNAGASFGGCNATTRLGGADTAAPTAQTVQVQNVATGTSNTAGANLTIAGSQGTGTGAGGAIILQTAPPGTTGTAQNALQNSASLFMASGAITELDLKTPTTVAPIRTYDDGGSNFVFSFGGNVLGFMYDKGNNSWVGSSTMEFGLGNTTNAEGAANGEPDTVLTRHAAANWQLGKADAAAPVAQTLSAQSVVAGTTNTAGANLTVNGSKGTGTGAGGSIIFQTAPAGTTGTAQNAEQAVLTLDANSHAKFSSAAIPAATCGTSPTVTAGSTDVAGEVTTGTTTTSCTVTFKIAYAAAPFCVATDATNLSHLTSYTLSTTAITMTMTSNSGDKVEWVCHGA